MDCRRELVWANAQLIQVGDGSPNSNWSIARSWIEPRVRIGNLERPHCREVERVNDTIVFPEEFLHSLR